MKPKSKPRSPSLKGGEMFFTTKRLRQEGVDSHWPSWCPFYMSLPGHEDGVEFKVIKFVVGGVIAKRIKSRTSCG